MTHLALLAAGLVVLLAAAAAGFIAGRCGRSRVPGPELSTLVRSGAPEPARPVPPWTLNLHASLISTDVALLVAQPADLQQAYRDVARVRNIASSIAEHGQREPLELIVDCAGRVVIRDGHHRLVATMSLGVGQVAVEFIDVPQRIPGFARPGHQVLAAIARTSCSLS